MLVILFWVTAAVVAYVYVGYPLLLWLLPRYPANRDAESPPSLPSVTLIISAFNEEACIAEKITNSLGLDYPRNQLKILVISDASDDGTDEIVNQFASDGVSLLRMEERGGKTLGLNAGVANTASDVVVFSDANAMYRHDAILQLAKPFEDSHVGAVIGESNYSDSGSGSGQSEGLYWQYETTIKRLESRSGSVVGGDGAIYGVRRKLYVPMSADDLSDFVNPLQVVEAGYRCVYQPAAQSFEQAAESFAKEYRRKVRIVNRAWRALVKLRRMLNPTAQGLFALKLFSHKLLRWWMPLFLLVLFLTNLMIATRSEFYMVTISMQVVFYVLATIGFALREREGQPALFRIPYYFCLVNFASAVGIIEAMGGRTYSTWSTARSDS